jgi:hypothetical protein
MKAMRHHYLGLACVGALALLPTSDCPYAQVSSSGTNESLYWVNVGFGGSSVHGGLGEDPDGGISVGLSLSYQKGSNLFSIRQVGCAEFKLDLFRESGPAESVWDIGALYGRVAKAPFGFMSIAGGVGVVGVSDDEGRTSLCMGLPIEGQMFWTPSSFVGFGLCGFADLNPDKSFFGGLLCLQVGKLR